MILFSLAFAYVMIQIIVSLTDSQTKKRDIQLEQERQRRELREAAKHAARFR